MTKPKITITLSYDFTERMKTISNTSIYPYLYYTKEISTNFHHMLALINDKRFKIKKYEVAKIIGPSNRNIIKTITQRPNYWPINIEKKHYNEGYERGITQVLGDFNKHEEFKAQFQEPDISNVSKEIRETLFKSVERKIIDFKDIRKILEYDFGKRTTNEKVNWITNPETNRSEREIVPSDMQNYYIRTLIEELLLFKKTIGLVREKK